MLKKVFALLLCVIMMAGLAACGGSGNTDTSSQSGTESSDTSSSENDKEKAAGYDKTMDHIFFATDRTNSSIVIFDLAKSQKDDFSDLGECVVWEWKSAEDPNCKGKPGVGIDCAKLRYSEHYKKDVVITTSSAGWAAIIDYETRSLIWEWFPGQGNFHSVEMMPNGDLVIAGSGDSGKIYYIPISTGATKPSHTIDSPSGHGVSYDPQNNWLWVLDYDEVYACAVSGYGTDKAKLTRINGIEAKFDKKEQDGHVLSPVFGEPGQYWVASSHAVYKFDSEEVALNPPPTQYQDKPVKGIAYYPDGTMIMTIAGSGENLSAAWACGEIKIVIMAYSTGKVKELKPFTYNIAIEGREFYKVLPVTKNYQ